MASYLDGAVQTRSPMLCGPDATPEKTQRWGWVCLFPQGCMDSLFPAHWLQKASEQSSWVGRALEGHLAFWLSSVPAHQPEEGMNALMPQC